MRHVRLPAAVLLPVLAALLAASLAPAGEEERPRLALAKILERGDPAPGREGAVVSSVLWPPVADGDAGDAIRPASGGSDGRPTALTGRGQVVFRAAFTDGSSGAFAAGLRR